MVQDGLLLANDLLVAPSSPSSNFILRKEIGVKQSRYAVRWTALADNLFGPAKVFQFNISGKSAADPAALSLRSVPTLSVNWKAYATQNRISTDNNGQSNVNFPHLAGLQGWQVLWSMSGLDPITSSLSSYSADQSVKAIHDFAQSQLYTEGLKYSMAVETGTVTEAPAPLF